MKIPYPLTLGFTETGALFSMLVRLMAAKSEVGPTETPDLTWLVVLLGRYFQIRDDYMNLTSAEVSTNSLEYDYLLSRAATTNMAIYSTRIRRVSARTWTRANSASPSSTPWSTRPRRIPTCFVIYLRSVTSPAACHWHRNI